MGNNDDLQNDIEMRNVIDIKNDPDVKDEDIYNDVKRGNELLKMKQNAKKVAEVDSEVKKLEDEAAPPLEAAKGVKRRASAAFSDDGMEEFKGFETCESSGLADYSRIVGKFHVHFYKTDVSFNRAIF